VSLCSRGQLLKHTLWNVISNVIKSFDFFHWILIHFQMKMSKARSNTLHVNVFVSMTPFHWGEWGLLTIWFICIPLKSSKDFNFFFFFGHIFTSAIWLKILNSRKPIFHYSFEFKTTNINFGFMMQCIQPCKLRTPTHRFWRTIPYIISLDEFQRTRRYSSRSMKLKLFVLVNLAGLTNFLLM